MKNIVILGSTGRIGIQALEIISQFSDKFNLIGISGYTNLNLLEQQILQYKPKYVAIPNNSDAKSFQVKYKDTKILSGKESLNEIVSLEAVDIVCVSIVGIAALLPTVTAIRHGKVIALASKEVLVAAGHIVMPLLEKHKTRLYPIDSEHAAIAMCLSGFNKTSVNSIILTASGGPFLYYKDLSAVTLEQALKHPNWVMGKKITIDSATLVNKGLEVIEAKWLFDISYDKIKVIIHPQSIVHGMIELNNGAVISQMSNPDMKMPILYALSEGAVNSRMDNQLDMTSAKLEFMEPDVLRFKGLRLAYESGRKGHSWPTVFNCANEVAVDMFLKREISFMDISNIIEETLNRHEEVKNPSLDDIRQIDNWVVENVSHGC